MVALSTGGCGRRRAGDVTARRLARARMWLLQSRAQTTDDKVFRLYGLHWLHVGAEEKKKAIELLLSEQRADGGWAQQDNMPGDAYATSAKFW